MTNYAANITSLEAAMAGGELRVEVNGEMVIFKSNEDILRAIAYNRQQLSGGATISNPAPAVTLANFGNG